MAQSNPAATGGLLARPTQAGPASVATRPYRTEGLRTSYEPQGCFDTPENANVLQESNSVLGRVVILGMGW